MAVGPSAPPMMPMAPASFSVKPSIIAPTSATKTPICAAALASYGYGPAAIRAVRPIERDGWKNAGRSFGVQRTLE